MLLRLLHVLELHTGPRQRKANPGNELMVRMERQERCVALPRTLPFTGSLVTEPLVDPGCRDMPCSRLAWNSRSTLEIISKEHSRPLQPLDNRRVISGSPGKLGQAVSEEKRQFDIFLRILSGGRGQHLVEG